MNITDLKLNDYAIICLSRINLRIGNFTASLHNCSSTLLFLERNNRSILSKIEDALNIYHSKLSAVE